jgi:hypothetical protein
MSAETRGPEYLPGDRVRIRRDRDFPSGPWPAEPSGTVVEHPLSEGGLAWRPVLTTSGWGRFYWVKFDESQTDADGDGPYQSSEVLDIYIEREDGSTEDGTPRLE